MGFMQQFQPQAPQVQAKAQLAQLRQIMQGGQQAASAAVSNLAQTNPMFAQFMAQNQGRTIEEAFRSYGYDLSEVLKTINS